MTDSSRFEEAKNWIDSIGSRWRLQILTKRNKTLQSGRQVEAPTRIRRFVEGVPWALVQDSIDYLLSLAPYTGMIYNGVEIDGTYRPTLTMWKRDDNDEVNSATSAKRNDGTYTLIQDLIDVDVADEFSAGTSLNCSEEVVTEWHWDEPFVGQLPASSEQGVTYAIQGVNRSDDGTFSYALVKRTAKTTGGVWGVQKSTPQETVETASWDNVYGCPGDFQADIPEPGSFVRTGAGGRTVTESVTLSWTQNDDCTYRVQATRSTFTDMSSEVTCQSDIFKHVHSEGSSGNAAPLPNHVPKASGGVVTKYESHLQDNGTYANRTSTDTELPVSESVVEITKGRRGVRTSVTDVNQPEPAPANPEIGGRVRTEKTPGGLYNNTVVTWDRAEDSEVAVSCRQDIYEHKHSVTEAGLSELPSGDVPPASGGVIRTVTADMDDEGSITRTDTVDTELPVERSRVSYSVGIRGIRTRVDDRNMSSPAPVPSFSLSNIGTTVTTEKTPGGLYNNSVEGLDRSGDPLDTSVRCERTVFEHSDSSSVTDPNGVLGDGHATAGGGRHERIASSMDDTGAVTTERVVTLETPVMESDVSYRRTAKALYVQKTDRNVMDCAVPPENAGESSSHSTNPGGSRNVTVTTVTVTGGVDRARCSTDVFTHSHDNVTVTVGDTADTSDAPEAGSGHSYVKESYLGDDGLVTTTVRDNTEVPVPAAEVSWRKTLRGLVTTTVDKNQPSAPEPMGPDASPGLSSGYRMNPGGSFDVTSQTKTASTVVDSARCEVNAFTHTHDTVTMGTEIRDVEAVGGSGGQYEMVVSDMDSEGFVKTVRRTTSEKLVDEGVAGNDNARYRSVVVGTRNGPIKSLPYSGSSEGCDVYSLSSSRTPGGNYDTKLETRSPKPLRKIKMVASGTLFKWCAIAFFNARSTDVVSFAEEVGRFASENNGSAFNPVSGSNMNVSVSMNEFALFDGQVSAMIRYPVELSYNCVTAEWDTQHHSIDITPMYDDGELIGASANKSTFVTHHAIGYGFQTFKSAVRSGDASPGGGTSNVVHVNTSYTPSNNHWSVSITRLEKVIARRVLAVGGTVDVSAAI